MRQQNPAGGRAGLIRLLKGLRLIDIARQIRSLWHAIEHKILLLMFPTGCFIRQNGAKLFVDFKDPNFSWYFRDNLFLKQEHEAFVRLLELQSPSTIVDIGAHWGIFPAMLDADPRFASKIKRVICIEPDVRNIATLKKTISKIKNFPVIIVNAAIGDCDSKISAYRDGGACMHTYPASVDSVSDGIVVVKTLATILLDNDITHKEVTHIKIDIDGYEPAFFLGNAALLEEMQPLVLSEYWAKGLLLNINYPVENYWSFLNDKYFIYRCNYPVGDYSLIGNDDFEELNSSTRSSVVNLLLLPKNLNLELKI